LGLAFEPINSGNNYIVSGYTGTDTEVVIPNVHRGKPVTAIKGGNNTGSDFSAFYNNKIITSVVIPEGVTSIGQKAFQHCTNLASVTIPESVTTIGTYAFQFCSSLTSIALPTSITTISEGMFYGCTNLDIKALPGITNIGNLAFQNCKSLTNITLSASLTNIGQYAFGGCTNLTSLTIPTSVTDISSNAFRDCSNLTIYAERASAPSGWQTNWNWSSRPVVWGCTLSADKTYVVSFTKGASSITDSTATNGIKAPYRAGYTFGGWNTAANGTGTTYPLTNNTQYNAIPNSTTLYAIWIV